MPLARQRPPLGKWYLWRHFAKGNTFTKVLPKTNPYNARALENFLRQFGMAYVKPVAGFGGRGITKVWRTPSGYATQPGLGATIHHRSMDSVISYIERRVSGKKYIVQQGIHLAKISGRPFDVRVMMQKGRGGVWMYTGMLARVSGKDAAVTNVATGRGYVLSIEEALRKSLGYRVHQIERMKRLLIELSRKVVQRMEEYQPYSQIGIDIGIDDRGQLWLIEENTFPSHSLFRMLPNLSMYQRIQRTSGVYHVWCRTQRRHRAN